MNRDMFNRTQWVCALLGLRVRRGGDVFADLEAAYDQPGRHYHSRQHVSDCLSLFEGYRDIAHHAGEVMVAIWFHDAVYDARRDDNEARSAQWAREVLEATDASAEVIERVCAMIMATQSHQPATDDEALLVDIDLNILAAPPEVFEAYDQAIRREYSWVPEDEYRSARAAVLRSFLERESVFHNDILRARFESRAQRNLKQKLAELGSDALR